MPPVHMYKDDCKNAAEVLARAKAARARLRAAKPRPVVVVVRSIPAPPPPAPAVAPSLTVPESPPRRIPVKVIIRVVAEYFSISVEDILSRRRERRCVFPRHVAMYIVWKSASWGYVATGRAFGGRDHTTVLFAVRKTEARLTAGHPETVTAVEIITTVLKAKFPNSFGAAESWSVDKTRPPRSMMPWTDEEKQHVADALIRDKRSPKEVAFELGRSDQRVRDIARIEFGWMQRGPRPKKVILRRPVNP